MKNSYSFADYLEQIVSDKKTRFDAFTGIVFLFSTFIGLGIVIAIYNVITGA